MAFPAASTDSPLESARDGLSNADSKVQKPSSPIAVPNSGSGSSFVFLSQSPIMNHTGSKGQIDFSPSNYLWYVLKACCFINSVLRYGNLREGARENNPNSKR